MRPDDVTAIAPLRGCPIVLALWAAGLPQAHAAVIRVQFGKTCPVMTPGQFGSTSIGASFIDGQPHDFNSIGAPEGSVITNQPDSGNTISGFKMTLPSGNTWDTGSTGGDLFGKPDISSDGRTITFKGGNIKPGDKFWIQMPRLTGGNYMGTVLTAAAPVPTPGQNIGVQPPLQIGTNPHAGTVAFDGSTTFTVAPWNVAFASYLDGSTTTVNTPSENLIGATVTIDPLQLMGASSDVPGAYRLSDSVLDISSGLQDVLTASLTNVLLIPEHGLSGSDSRIQATLSFTQGLPDIGSQFLDQLLATAVKGPSPVLYFDSSILGASDNLTVAGSSAGTGTLGALTPEPNSPWLCGSALLLLWACRLISKRGCQKNYLLTGAGSEPFSIT